VIQTGRRSIEDSNHTRNGHMQESAISSAQRCKVYGSYQNTIYVGPKATLCWRLTVPMAVSAALTMTADSTRPLPFQQWLHDAPAIPGIWICLLQQNFQLVNLTCDNMLYPTLEAIIARARVSAAPTSFCPTQVGHTLLSASQRRTTLEGPKDWINSTLFRCLLWENDA